MPRLARPPHAKAEDESDAKEDTAPLLSSSNVAALNRTVSQATLKAETSEDDSTYLHEFLRLGELSLPLIASSLTGFFVGLIGIAFVGRLGKVELSTAILATSFFNITGLTFLIGSLGALETLCGQAYGAKNYRQVGVAFQRALLLTLSLAIGVCVLWTQTEQFLLALGQDPVLAAGAARYLKLNSPALFFIGAGECLKRYLSAQGIVAPASLAALAAVTAAPGVNYLLIFVLKLGLDGAAIASVLSQFAPFVVLLWWTLRREKKLKGTTEQTWYGWSSEALKGWSAYMRLAAPSAAMVCLEWTTFEACIIMSGWLANPELQVAVMGLLLNISGVLYMLPLGVGAATSIRVSNALGAGLPRAARRASTVAVVCTCVMQLCLAAVAIVSASSVGKIFTSEVDVIQAAAAVVPLLAACLVGDGINAVLGGMMRGCGRQELGAWINLLAFWVVGLPLAAALAFKAKLGVAGLWAGLAICSSGNASMLFVIMCRTNWQKEAEKALDTFKAAHVDLENLGGDAAVLGGSSMRRSSDIQLT